ncbi:MAG: ABC transporter ATP-binding protein [Ectothiorhodospiraceae bacterium]|nr:ABC transporter ATP-binding protein [Ectothiorhodospiraceae bacterium]MCH8502688.1 energy-coupling factor ABC transporter ATP-binding protein [Ectothiorhodospiraceae bacterium]
MIVLDGVSFHHEYGVALDNVSLHIAAGERVVLLGANGCGKSTLLKLMNGLLLPQQGQVLFQGTALTHGQLRDRRWSREFRRQVGLLFQDPDAMLFNPTVAEEIGYSLRQLPVEERDRRIRHWAAELGLSDLLDTPPFRLSGGEKQRLCLAAVLVLEPALLLMDEPTANLDPRATGWLVDFLLDLEQVTTVVSTHNLSLAAELGDRALMLSEDHRLIYDGPLAAALSDQELLWRANLAHRHRRRRGEAVRIHTHQEWS